MKVKPWPLAVLAVVLLIGFTVWPTRYRYDHSGSQLLRINRITGRTWQYVENGLWVSGGEVDGLPPSNPNAVDTAAAMAPAPAPASMDTLPHTIDELYAKIKRDSIAAAEKKQP